MTVVRSARVALMLESDGPGGAEMVLLQLAEELRRRGHHVVAIGPANGCGILGDQLRSRGFATDVFRLVRPFDPACLVGLRDTLRRHRMDVVHSHEFTMAVYGAAAARWLGLPHVVTMHGSQTAFTARRRRAALRLAFGASRATVAVSRATHAYMTRIMGARPGQYLTIPNGVAFTPGSRDVVRRELGLAPRDRLVVAVGNLSPRKGHIHLLRALVSMPQDGPSWHLAIAGRGPEDEVLRAAAAQAGCTARLHLLGHRTDVADILAAADVYAMPSLWEGLPMALLEAMFAGKPIVASRTEGIPEAIDHGVHGLLVPPGDAAELASALSSLFVDENLAARLAANALDRANREFSAAAMTEAYERAYGIRD